jgi:16S rRNA (uracil1498-N3)-methyltransferase
MRLHRFFIEEPLRNKKDISLYDDELIHQWKDVFRFRAGNRLILLDNTGFEYLAEIDVLAKGNANVRILETTPVGSVPKKDIWLYAALIKKDNFEWILEKVTELGVNHIVPLLTERTEKKDLNTERALKILKEASEQSGRGILPELHEVMKLEEALNKAVNPLAFHVEGDLFTQSFLEFSDQASLFIGPEGGWTEREVELFKAKDVPLVTVGTQVLRAETAAIAISSLILL